MKKTLILWTVLMLLGAAVSTPARSEGTLEVPVKGMVTLVDLGAHKCIPCKMMAPILDKLKTSYQGRAAIVFLDVWQNPDYGKQFGIRAIPTQIFFDETGREFYRHQGFLDEKSIVDILTKMGVKAPADIAMTTK